MFKVKFATLCQRVTALASAFMAVQKGSILIYTGAFMSIGVGGAAVSIDIGRIVLLRTQMQNRADAGALAGAAQIDDRPGIHDRVTVVVEESMKAYTTAAAAVGELAVWYTKTYGVSDVDYSSMGDEEWDDEWIRFVEVVMQRRTLSFFYAPAMTIMTGATPSKVTTLDARAVAMADPFVCKAQPLMFCNPFDDGVAATVDPDLRDPAYAGFGIMIKKGAKNGGAWAPGNWGLLDLPEDAAYPSTKGANAIMYALEAEEPTGCYGVRLLGLMPGNKTSKVEAGLNVRFGQAVTDATVKPAPNVMNYPNDNAMVTDPTLTLGDGVWDLAGYWTANHAGVPLPAILADATRYQIYLLEQDELFWKKGKETFVGAASPGAGWSLIDPVVYATESVLPTNAGTPHDNWTDGHPPTIQTASTQGHKRRLMKVAMVNCATYTFKGNGSVPSSGKYLEIMLTQEAGADGSGQAIYGEVVRGLTALNSLEYHGNVRLVE